MISFFELYAQEFKVIGYLPYYRFELIDEIQFEYLTQVNIAFANPDMDGDLSIGNRDLAPVINHLRDYELDVYLSLAGGALTDEWLAAWNHLMIEENRSNYISRILRLLRDFKMDGIDMDLEWSHVNELYSPFVIELADSLQKYDMGLSAALPGTYRYPDITDEALAAFDYINMMVYDFTGPWGPKSPGQHSSFMHAINSTNHWTGQGMSFDRLTLGLPFYGYNFNNPNNVFSMSYRNIIDEDPDFLSQQDQIEEIYYNGIPTILEKTEFAKNTLAGIMIWELALDDFGEYSLLRQINNALSGTVSTNEIDRGEKVVLYPNPCRHILTVEKEATAYDKYELISQTGFIIQKGDFNSSLILIDVASFPTGTYYVRLIGDKVIAMEKFIKV